MLGSEFLFGESIGGGLELGDMVILGDDFQLVERAAKENSLSHHAANTYGGGRDEPDFLAGAGQIIFRILDAVVTQVADARLAAAAKLKQVSANFFQFSPTGCQRRDTNDQAGDARVGAGLVERVNVIVEHGDGAVESAEEVRGALLFDLAAGVHHQDGIGWYAQARFGSGPNHRANQKYKDQDDYDRSTLAPGHRHSPLPHACVEMAEIAG